MTTSVTYCTQGFRGFDGAYLVHGVTKRAIRVVVRPFPGVRNALSSDDLAVKAAYRAARKGWKTVFVAPDEVYGDDAMLFNTDQFFVGNLQRGFQGAYLCSAEDQWGGYEFKTSKEDFENSLPLYD